MGPRQSAALADSVAVLQDGAALTMRRRASQESFGGSMEPAMPAASSGFLQRNRNGAGKQPRRIAKHDNRMMDLAQEEIRDWHWPA